MDLKLKSKTAYISGSTQGIGFAIARKLLEEGVTVIINGRTTDKLDKAVIRLKKEVPGANVTGIRCDFSKREEIESMLWKLPQIDILINNVGIFELKAFTEITEEDWQNYFEVNVLSGIRLSKALLPGMLLRNWGRIIFISSESGVNIPENMIHYGMTKTAMLSLSRGLAQTTKKSEVTVNSILGGPTYSEQVAGFIEAAAVEHQQDIEVMKQYIINETNPTSLLQRFIEPAEIANMVAYLASPLASATNGASLRVDGGVLNSIL